MFGWSPMLTCPAEEYTVLIIAPSLNGIINLIVVQSNNTAPSHGVREVRADGPLPVWLKDLTPLMI